MTDNVLRRAVTSAYVLTANRLRAQVYQILMLSSTCLSSLGVKSS